jgi:phosphonate transport system substrate-binding protein
VDRSPFFLVITTSRNDVRFGIVSASSAASDGLRKLCDELSKQVGQPFTSRVFRSYPELTAQMRAGEIDIGWAQPLAAVELEMLGAGVIALGVWRGAGSTFQSAIFVPASSSITRIEQLRGKRMAWVDPSSSAGYLFPKQKLISMGLHPDKFFVLQSFHRTHEEVAKTVMEGRADVGATCVAFFPGTGKIQSAGWSKGGAYADSDVRILLTHGPIPTDALVFSTRFDDKKRKQLADALMKASVVSSTRDLVQTLFSAQGFVFVGSSQYEPLRAMVTLPASAPKVAASGVRR